MIEKDTHKIIFLYDIEKTKEDLNHVSISNFYLKPHKNLKKTFDLKNLVDVFEFKFLH